MKRCGQSLSKHRLDFRTHHFFQALRRKPFLQGLIDQLLAVLAIGSELAKLFERRRINP